MIETRAASNAAASAPSRAGSAASQATRTSGAAGTADGGDDQAEHVEGRQGVGHLVGRREGHPDRRSAPPQRDAEGERAAEGVGVGLHVSQQRDVGGVGEHVGGGPYGVGGQRRSSGWIQ